MKSFTYKAKRRRLLTPAPEIEVVEKIDTHLLGRFYARYNGVIVTPHEYEYYWEDIPVPSLKLTIMLVENHFQICKIGKLVERLKEHVRYFKA